mmetsp:Transcript_325/g.1521  ORF Transcript_325/g.1521 Transcript_325/m.1521 type:complete len:255 (+) Transcript_325:428-1192(+)
MPKSVPFAAAPPTAMPALAPPTAIPPAARPAPSPPRMPTIPAPTPTALAPLIPFTAPFPTPAPTLPAALAPAAPPASRPCAALDTSPGTTARSGIAFLSWSAGGKIGVTSLSTSRSTNRAVHVASNSARTHTNPPATLRKSAANPLKHSPRHRPRVVTGATVSMNSTTTTVRPKLAPWRWYHPSVDTPNSSAVRSRTNPLAYPHVNGMHTKLSALSFMPVNTLMIRTVTMTMAIAHATFAPKNANAPKTSASMA